MTRVEAIKKIKSICHDCKEFPHCVNTDSDCFKALEMAREILEQKPCGDGISRQEVLSYIERILNQGTGKKKSFQFIRKYIESLPSIQPKTDVLDKIKAEIKEESRFCPLTEGLERALEIIDKYKTESLEQQPTAKENLVVGDCISRKAVMDYIKDCTVDLGYVNGTNMVLDVISNMPSIQPKLKTDEPMQVELEGDGYSDGKLVYDYGKCPKCGWQFEYGNKDWEEPYCCHCGQRLKWFESEDKE